MRPELRTVPRGWSSLPLSWAVPPRPMAGNRRRGNMHRSESRSEQLCSHHSWAQHPFAQDRSDRGTRGPRVGPAWIQASSPDARPAGFTPSALLGCGGRRSCCFTLNFPHDVRPRAGVGSLPCPRGRAETLPGGLSLHPADTRFLSPVRVGGAGPQTRGHPSREQSLDTHGITHVPDGGPHRAVNPPGPQDFVRLPSDLREQNRASKVTLLVTELRNSASTLHPGFAALRSTPQSWKLEGTASLLVHN